MRRPLIIERPDLQTGGQRWLSLALTLLFWLFYLYLWLPLVTLAGWAFGFWRGYEVFFAHQGYQKLLTILMWYASGIALLSATLILWAIYNLVRFRGKERRRRPRPISLIEQANFFGVQPYALAIWRRAKVIVVTHDQLGRIMDVTVRAKHAPATVEDATGPPPLPAAPARAPEVVAIESATIVPLRRGAQVLHR